MPVVPFATDTVHGLSADVYFGTTPLVPSGAQLRVFGDVLISTTVVSLDLTANDEGNVNPVAVLRRGDTHRITVPVSDASKLAILSGVVFPFATSVSGISGTEVILPKAQPGDNFLNKAKQLRLVLRDGSATFIYPKAVVTEVQDLTLSEENQMAYAVTFTAFRTTISGVETPFKIISGSVVSGADAGL